MTTLKKGFTLIELLIVIGILAVLATITVLVLNPAQLFAQARDSQRISDLNSTKSAITLYLTTVKSGVDLGDASANFTCGTNFSATVDGVASTFAVATTAVTTGHDGVFTVTGLGWVPVNLASTTGGAPIPVLPRDPVNDATYHYLYSCNNTARTFELNSMMESERYANGGADDVENTDGGDDENVYEVGTNLAL